MSSKLSERAMLVAVHRSSWSGAVVDKAVTEDVRSTHDAENGAGRYTKVLVNPKFFSCVTRPLSQADAVWKRLSLPWSPGDRIMGNMAHPQFVQEMHAARLALEAGKAQLARLGGEIHGEAQQRLKTMYNPDEYPSMDEIINRFDLEVELKPVPEGGDFRTKLSDATVKAIKKDIEVRTKDRMDKAVNDVYSRVLDVVGKMVTGLKTYEPKTDTSKGRNFKDSLVYNVQEVAELLPTLNITLDKRVDALRVQLVDDLTMVPPDLLKSSDAAREAALQKAEKLFAKVQGFMS